MPLVTCYEIYLKRDGNRPIFLTRVRDATNALNIARHQVDILNESWLRKVTWTADVMEASVDEDLLNSDDPAQPLYQGDIIDEQVQRPLIGSIDAAGDASRDGDYHYVVTDPAERR